MGDYIRKLSIITINFNNSAGLERTVESVLSQTFSDYEYIIIDGGSTDGSVEIIKKHETHIDYWVSEQDKGVYHAMNKGILKASGEYCYFLNSGDFLWTNDVLEKVFLQSNGEDIVYGNMIHGGLNTVDHGMQEIRFFNFFVGSIYHQSAFIKRELFKVIGLYNESLNIVSDWEFFVKAIFLENCSIHYINISIALYETGGLSFQDLEGNLRERRQVLEQHFPLYLKDYEELKKFKLSDFAGIYKLMDNNPLIKYTLKGGLRLVRFLKFKIFRRSY